MYIRIVLYEHNLEQEYWIIPVCFFLQTHHEHD